VAAFNRPDPPAGEPGWYPDPAGPGSYRYWDGRRWIDAVSSAIPPAGRHDARDDSRSFALTAHLSALLTIFVAFPFVGPLVILLSRQDDPFVRGHALEALNFNLTMMLLIVGLLLLIAVVDPLPFALLIPVAVAWLVLICVAATTAGQGKPYRYPLTIRFFTD
jgi:uncharacterized protein